MKIISTKVYELAELFRFGELQPIAVDFLGQAIKSARALNYTELKSFVKGISK